jgi:prepilin peptidase CpaA
MNTFASPAVLCILVLAGGAAYSDLRTRRIPNALVLAGLAAALPVQWSAHHGSAGLWQALAGCATGVAVLLPFYLLRAFGAGDVKLMGALGALGGASMVLSIALATFVIGGIGSLALIAARRQWRTAGESLFVLAAGLVQPGMRAAQGTALGRLPYGVAIALGALVVVIVSH